MSLLAKTAHAKTFSEIMGDSKVGPLVGRILDAIVIPLVQGLFLLAALIFIWGIFKMIYKGADPTARKEGQNSILWGVIGMAIMVSVYGIVRLIGNTVGIDPFQ